MEKVLDQSGEWVDYFAKHVRVTELKPDTSPSFWAAFQNVKQ